MNKPPLITFLLAAFLAAWPARAHEVWLEPTVFQGAPDTAIVSHLKIGMAPKGDLLAYLPFEIIRATVTDEQGARPITGLVGDVPAVVMTPRAQGLHIIAYETEAQRLTYEDPKKFPDFLAAEGLTGIAERHAAKGLGPTGFTEAYSRCSKSLITRGGPQGHDKALGQTFEIVALENPYDGSRTALPVQVLWKGQPHPDGQIAVFRKGVESAVAKVRTDARGRATIPLAEPGAYILNAVTMLDGFERPTDAWHSYWASLTFEVK